MNTKILINQLRDGHDLGQIEITQILDSKTNPGYLFSQADQVRTLYCGNAIHLRAIIEFSNYCRCRCSYCGLNAENTSLIRYRMSSEEILENAWEAHQAGYRTIVLQSGEDPGYTKTMIADLIKEIKSLGDVAVTLSLGERDFDEYYLWRKAGADRYLLKHETADPILYDKLHPHSTFAGRIKCLQELKRLGYQTGSGFMVGLPGQTTATIARDILLLKELQVDMAGIGPFIPHARTSLAHLPPGSLELTLKSLAVTRLFLKKVNLPATTAYGVAANDRVLGDGDLSILPISPFSCGANVLMKKVEPHRYRSLYDIYPKKPGEERSILEERKEAEAMIIKMKRQVAPGRGDCFIEYNQHGR
ncbi:MAG TPA: [FeFe] hydrogenase H-cluster radical SAM maturase HydE [Clostridia bacterium]|nr:[FeFe] hydrogenase H-cluster radical SAM maturase HydE [Clostridia bacterium]